MNIKSALVYASIALFCASCSANSVPAVGYQKYKDMNTDYLISIGGTGKEIKYNSCSYAYITGDGVYEAGTLKETVYYCATWTMTLGSGSTNAIEYFVYYKSTDQIATFKDSTAYTYACELISDGSLAGQLGRL